MTLLISTTIPALGTMYNCKPLNVQQEISPVSTKDDETTVTYLDPPLPAPEIKVTGGMLGYKVTVKNVGDETFSGNLSMTIKTAATVMIMGEEISAMPAPISLPSGESKDFWMRPAFGFGPATITVEAEMRTSDTGGFSYSGEGSGFVLLFYVSGSCETLPLLLREDLGVIYCSKIIFNDSYPDYYCTKLVINPDYPNELLCHNIYISDEVNFV